jgi:hypothetical protein
VTEPSASRGTSFRPRRWQVVLAANVAVLGALRIALPYAVEAIIEWQGAKALGVPVAVDDVDFTLVRAAVAIEGLVVGGSPGAPAEGGAAAEPAGAEAALARCGRIAVRLGPLGLFRRELHVRTLEVDAPWVVLVRDADGSVRVPLPPPPEPAAGAEPEPPPAAGEPAGPEEPGLALRLDALAVRGATTELVEARSGNANSLELEVEDLTLADVALRGRELSLGPIGIRGPSVRVRHDLLRAPGTPPPPAPAKPAAPAPALHVAGLELERAQVVIATEDASLPITLSLRVQEEPGQADPRYRVDLRAELAEGQLELEGVAALKTLGFEGALRWSGLALGRILAAAGALPIRLQSGQGGGELALRAELAPGAGAPGVRASGRIDVRGIELDDRAGAFGVAFASLEVVADEVHVPSPQEGLPAPPLRVALSRLHLRDPVVKVRRTAPAAAAAEDQAPAPAAEADAAATPIELSVRDLQVSGGRAAFEDQTVSPAFRGELRDLRLTAAEVAWPERRVRDVRLALRGPGAASHRVSGSLAPEGGAITLAVAGVELPALNPYLAPLGLRIDRGTFGVEGSVRARGERSRVATEVRVAALDLGRAEAGGFQATFGVPLDVGVALLKDSRGVIELPIAFDYQRNELRVALRRTVLAALQRAIAGALIAPLRGLGGAVSKLGDVVGLGMDPLPSQPGSADLAAAAADRLGGLRGSLAARPALALVLRGRAGPADDPRLAEAMLSERVLAGEGLPDLEGVGFLQRRRVRGALAERGRGEGGALEAEDEAALARYVAGVAVPPERRAALARARAEAARAALLSAGALEPERVRIGEVEEGDPGVVLELEAARRAADGDANR